MKLLQQGGPGKINRLFFICPFSQLEVFLQNHYGDRPFFATSIATRSQFNDSAYANSIIELIINEGITEIGIVVDTNCRFINSVLQKRSSKHFKSTYQMQEILDLHITEIVRQKTFTERKQLFAKLVIHQQVEEMCKVNLFKLMMMSRQIAVKGIISTKAANELEEVSIKHFRPHDGLSITDFKLN
ncbi:MAG TPA: hypothetical protein PLV21_06615 [Cyclobacteriaceae bacterium]|nr:hypothetical protein [Cyclobacteriaceae bacterium]HRJ81535.1 hypothetical protein [Cyclobacteriaceae bacterium]